MHAGQLKYNGHTHTHVEYIYRKICVFNMTTARKTFIFRCLLFFAGTKVIYSFEIYRLYRVSDSFFQVLVFNFMSRRHRRGMAVRSHHTIPRYLTIL